MCILKYLVVVSIALSLTMRSVLGASSSEGNVTVYSDICIHSDSGDLLGARILVMRFREGDYVLFQMAEGVIEAPQIGKANIDSKTGDIVFRIPESDKLVVTFRGKINDQALTGAFDNHWVSGSGEKIFRLPKLIGRQQSFPTCR
jgi:hypothetical protein